MNKPSVLLIHGFTSHRSSLEVLVPALDKQGIEWAYPILAGHGTNPKDLADKRWHHWQDDVDQAYRLLRQANDQVVIVALSMGTLLAMELAVAHPKHVAGLVLLSPCIKFKNKMTALTPIVSRLVKGATLSVKDRYSSMDYAKEDKGYFWFPIAPFRSYWERTRTVGSIIEHVRCPVRIIQSRIDNVADPRGAQEMYNLLKSQKELLWHEKSGHEMLLDCETDQVLKEILEFWPLRA